MKYEERTLTECGTGAVIKKYEPIFDMNILQGYMIHFDNGYRLELDRDEITEKELRWLIKNKVYVRMNFRLHLWKGDLNKKKTSKSRKTNNGTI